jgi:hypothetical protein
MIRHESNRYESVNVVTGPLFLPAPTSPAKNKKKQNATIVDESSNQQQWVMRYPMIGRPAISTASSSSSSSASSASSSIETLAFGDAPRVHVPTHYFKAVLACTPTGELAVASWIIPNHTVNAKKSVETFRTSLVSPRTCRVSC